MAGFSKTDGPADLNEDVIITHLGRSLTDEQFERVLRSVIVANIGIDN